MRVDNLCNLFRGWLVQSKLMSDPIKYSVSVCVCTIG